MPALDRVKLAASRAPGQKASQRTAKQPCALRKASCSRRFHNGQLAGLGDTRKLHLQGLRSGRRRLVRGAHAIKRYCGMRNQATLVTTDGQAPWNAPLTMKAQEPRRFAVWKPLPAFSHPMDTERYAVSIATAPAQPDSSNSSSMTSFRSPAWTFVVGLPGLIPLSCSFNSNYGDGFALDQLHSTEDMV